MKRYVFIPLAVVAVLVLARLSFYTVDAAEYVYVTVLGRHAATYDGADRDHGAGLKIGWPWPVQQVLRLDRRLQHFDLPPTDQLTHNPEGNTVDKLLSIEAYVCWKISDEKGDDKGVDRFVKHIGSADRARKILEPLIISRLGAEIGQMRMDDLVNTIAIDPAAGVTKVDVTIETLRNKLLASLKQQVRDEYGIDLIDVRLRRFNHPYSVRDSIFERIRTERNKEATVYESDGRRQASNIDSATEQTVRETLAKALSKEAEIKATADIEATAIRNKAYSQDPEFYAFLKNLEKMQSILGSQKTMLLLSTHRQAFELLFTPPRPKTGAAPGKDKGGAK